ncbi:MAG TPA: hypothetical protein VGF48_23755 [Thermoanaerobaculia bacterium]
MPALRTALALTLTLAITTPLVAHELHYAYCEKRSCSMNGVSSDTMEALRRNHDRAAVIEQKGVEYVITDPATLDRIKELLRPQMELGRKQAALGAEQARLGAEQARLGSQQAALGARQAALAMQRDSDREQKELSRQQNALGAQQGELGRQQGLLGKQQGELGRQQGAAGREVQRKIEAMADELIRTGKAKRR